MAKEENYFSWDNFDEIAEIDLHLSYSNEIVNKYDFSEETRKNIFVYLDKIKECQKKSSIKVCIIGEASTGKSAFINAFLRMDLLTSGALQGTTLICTYIEYSLDYRITIENTDGDIRDEVFTNIDELRDKIYIYTTNQHEVEKIRKIIIGVPSNALSGNIQIVDTPAINSNFDWYNNEEGENLREIADALIILTDANKAMPQSLVDFINRKLFDERQKYVFVATKCDIVHSNGRDDSRGIKYVLDYIKKKVKSEFNIDSALVLPYAAMDIIDDLYKEGSPSKELIDLSGETETIILNHLSKQEFFTRKETQLKALTEVYDLISLNLNDIVTTYKQDISFVKQEKDIDLDTIIQQQCNPEKEKFDENTKTKVICVADQMYSVGLEIIRFVFRELDEIIQSGQSLVNKQVAGLCVERITRILTEVYNFYQECKDSYIEYRDQLKKTISEAFKNKSIEDVLYPRFETNSDVSFPVYAANIWNNKIRELYDKVMEIKRPLQQMDTLRYVMERHIEETVNFAVKGMNACAFSYTQSEKGIIDVETRLYCDMNKREYKELVDKWFQKEMDENVKNKKELIEQISDDENRIKNRRFSIESCSEQLEKSRKGRL